jgi:hypothetical protein
MAAFDRDARAIQSCGWAQLAHPPSHIGKATKFIFRRTIARDSGGINRRRRGEAWHRRGLWLGVGGKAKVSGDGMSPIDGEVGLGAFVDDNSLDIEQVH